MLNNDQLVNRQVVVLELDCNVNQLILQCVNKELELAAMRASGADYVLAKMKQITLCRDCTYMYMYIIKNTHS